MQVFNAYMKIIKKRLPAIMIYFVVFLIVALVISGSYANSMGPLSFNAAKAKIAFFNNDKDSALIDGLEAYLQKNTQFISVPDTAEDIQDAFFYDQISYVLRVPEGFTESFASGGNMQLQKMAGAASANSVFVDLMVQKYLDISAFYMKNMPGASLEEIAANAGKDLEIAAGTELKNFSASATSKDLSFYFNFLAYSILAVLIMGVTSAMIAFNEADLGKRNQCAPIRPAQMNFQIVLGNGVFALGVWALSCASIFIFSGHAAFDAGTILLCLNALVFTTVGLAIGFLVGKFVKGGGVQSAVTNVVSLGLSFISGVFVPQELLGGTVQTISSFLPAYWYVKAVNDINNLVEFNLQALTPVIISMLIQIGFAVAIIVIAMAVTKQKKTSFA